MSVVWGASPNSAAAEFEFKDNDRVVLLGGTFFEREYNYAQIETLLTARFPEKHMSFRNLSWSGDNVWGAARASFDTPKEGYERMMQVVKDAKPTLILLSYGQVESFETENTFEQFAEQLDVLLNDLESTGARIAIVSPTLLEKLDAPLPDPAAHNEQIKQYVGHLKGVAELRGYGFVDMTSLITFDPAAPMTDNTMHFTENSYRLVAQKLLEGLGYEAPPGYYESGVDLSPKSEALRKLVHEKNRLFFNKWRPQNETYIYGFRKYEQGRFQAETPMYDPLVAALEEQIAQAAAATTGKD